MFKRHQTLWISLLLFVLAFGVRVYQLDTMPTQNDEQLWLARAYDLVHGVFNSEPDLSPLTTIYSDNGYVDVFAAGRAWFPEVYPFTIRTKAHHPGIIPTLMIGLSYVFLADGSHPASLDLLPITVAIKLPNVFVGSLVVVVVYLGATYWLNRRIGLIAALMIAVSPLMIGFSRVARIDMMATLFTTAMFFSYVVLVRQTTRRSQIKWAMLAGLFAGLGMTTIPYAVYIVPIFALVKILYSEPTKYQGIRRFLPDVYDLLFIATWIIVYVLTYPNLWANPIAGFELWLDNTFARPHLEGDDGHLTYVEYVLWTTLPTTMALALVGIGAGWKRFRPQVVIVLAWVGWFLLLLSIPSGGKHLKNIMQLSVPISILVGITLDWLSNLLAHRWKTITSNQFFAVLCASQVLIGLLLTAYWWPLPHLYVAPGVYLKFGEYVGLATSHGIKPSLDYAYDHSQIPPDRFIARSGRNNLMFYLPEESLDYHVQHHLEQADWLFVLPKNYVNSQDLWFYDVEPTHILVHRQVELAYLYYLPDFFPREMYDTSSPMIVYDNGIEIYDIEWEVQDGQLEMTSLWGQQPDSPYGFSLQLFDGTNNKVAQGDFLLPTEVKQVSMMDLSTLESGDYRIDLIVYDLATASSVNGRIIETDTGFERVYTVGSVTIDATEPG